MNREPAITVGTISAAVAAVLGLVVAFGAPLTDDQQAAILGVVAVLAPIVAAVVTRSKVFSPETFAAATGGVPDGTGEHRADAGYSVIELAVGVLVLVILVVVLFRLL